eukprot:ctg_311.g221
MFSLAFLPTVLPWRRQGGGQAGGRSVDRPVQWPTAAVGRGAFVVSRNPSFPLPVGAEPASGSRQAPCFLLRMAEVKAPTAADLNGSSGGGGDGDGGGTATLTAGNIEPSDVTQILSRSYLEYALSVIHARALPDARDGLKPVHRRILYAMSQLGLNPNSQFRKCARVVGEVLGRFHPHGDSAVYDALIRMAQPFSMLEPLVDGQGNLGSVDGDKAAAMRYTECRLTSLSKVALLADLDRATVDFAPNFDGSDNEPAVLPARVPNLLLNGSHGIAVGMATNVPPHNLSELVAALQALIENPELSDEELIAYVPAPDFPTGRRVEQSVQRYRAADVVRRQHGCAGGPQARASHPETLAAGVCGASRGGGAATEPLRAGAGARTGAHRAGSADGAAVAVGGDSDDTGGGHGGYSVHAAAPVDPAGVGAAADRGRRAGGAHCRSGARVGQSVARNADHRRRAARARPPVRQAAALANRRLQRPADVARCGAQRLIGNHRQQAGLPETGAAQRVSGARSRSRGRARCANPRERLGGAFLRVSGSRRGVGGVGARRGVHGARV